jgi:hypothetical protein
MDKMYKVAIAVVIFVIAVLGCWITIYQTFHVPLAYAIQAESVERAKCDEKIKIGIEDKLDKMIFEQTKQGKQLVRIEAVMGIKGQDLKN